VATVTGVIGDGVGDGEGRTASREMVVSRTIEGEVSLSMRSAMSVAEFAAVKVMVVGVVTRLSSKNEVKERERKGRKRKKGKGSTETRLW
jgi:hypothetical protein